MFMGDEMGERAGRSRYRHEDEKPDRTEAARQRTAKRQQPQHVETNMAEIGVQQRIGDEGPDLGAGATGKRVIQQRLVITLRNEPEDIYGPVLQFRGQQHAQVNDRDQDDIGRQRGRQRQDRFAWSLRRDLWRQFRRRFCGRFHEQRLMRARWTQIGGFERLVQVHNSKETGDEDPTKKGGL